MEGVIVCCTARRASLEEISEASRKRARYREMAAEGLIDFEQRGRSQSPSKILARRPDKSYRPCSVSPLESYADLVPEAIDALGSEERHRAYRIIGLEVHLAPDGSFEISGDVMSFSRLKMSSA